MNLKYEQFEDIGRTVHLEDLDNIIINQELIGTSRGTDVANKYKGLWFKAVQDRHLHDWYGNIRFQLSIRTLLGTNMKHIYMVEERDIESRTICTILISDDSSLPYSKIDISKKGHPIWKDCNTYHHVVSKNNQDFVVEILVDGRRTVNTSKLYKLCARVVVNHSRANTKKDASSYHLDICHRYNRRGCECPTNLTIAETEKKIR